MIRVPMTRRFLLFLLLNLGTHHACSQKEDYTSPTPKSNNIINNLPHKINPATPSNLYQSEDFIEPSETIVYNKFANPPASYNQHPTIQEDPEGPADHIIPHSTHEEPKEIPTRPKYNKPGEWAKLKSKTKEKDEFVPTKLLAQVRGIETLKVVPQKEAIESSKTEEEKENAPRLREVLTNSKVNTIYTEEGYEDSAYDHAGHIRDADFHEGFARKLREKMNVRRKSQKKDESEKERDGDYEAVDPVDPQEFQDYEDDYRDHDESRRVDGENGEDKLVQDEVHPRLIAENGIQRLQEDLEKEVEEIERGGELKKVRSDSGEKDNSNLEEYGPVYGEESGDDGRRHETPSTRLQEINVSSEQEEKEVRENYANYGTTPRSLIYETTIGTEKIEDFATDPSGGPSEVLQRSPVIVQTSPEEETTTLNYGQIFWDFFKSRENPTTMKTSLVQETGSIPKFTPVQNLTGLNPYLSTQEGSTPFTIDLETFHPQKFSFRPGEIPNYQVDSTNKNYIESVNNLLATPSISTNIPLSEDKISNEWQPLTLSEASPIETSLFTMPKISPAKPSNLKQESNPETIFLDNPVLQTTKSRRPRYKVLSRHKPGIKSSKYDYHKSKSPGKSSNKTPQNIIPSTDTFSEQYLKMLAYVRAQENLKTHKNPWRKERPIDPISRTRQNVDHLSRMVSPSPQTASEVAYYNFLQDPQLRPISSDRLSMTIESEPARKTNPMEFPVSLKEQRYIRSENEEISHTIEPSVIFQPSYVHRKKSPPATILLPPGPLTISEYERFYPMKKKINSFTGSGIKREKNPSITEFRYSQVKQEGKIHGRKRKRRFAEHRDDVDVDRIVDVKGTEVEANNGASNRSKIEWAEKNDNAKMKRNSMDTGNVLDTYGQEAKQNGEKKSQPLRFYGGDRAVLPGESLHKDSDSVERESYAGLNQRNTREKNNKALFLDESDGKIIKNNKKKLYQSVELKELSRNHGKGRGRRLIRRRRNLRDEINLQSDSLRQRKYQRRKTHEDLLNESPRLTGVVIDKEINSRFNANNEGKKDAEAEEVEVEIPDFDYVEELTEEDHPTNVTTATEVNLDLKKYPFYNNRHSSSTLRYATDPRTIPRKTSGGMEFYNSRDAYKQCDEVEANLDEVLPQEEEPIGDRGLKENLPRLRGLGDKLDCLKAKYFDENPFDNPLFLEKEVEAPIQPSELNSADFSARISFFPKENDEYVVQKPSRKPENVPRHPISANRLHGSQQSIRLDYKRDPRTGRGRNGYFQAVRGGAVRNTKVSDNSKPRNAKIREVSPNVPADFLHLSRPFQSQVYEDVMGNIRQLSSLYKIRPTTQSSQIINDEVKTRVSGLANKLENNGNISLIDITEKPRDFTGNGGGFVPLRYSRRYPINYGRGGRQRSRGVGYKPKSKRIIGHYQKIEIHKRSLRDETEAEFPVDAERIMKKDTATFYGKNNRKRRSRQISNVDETEESKKIMTRRNSRMAGRRKSEISRDNTTSGINEAAKETPRAVYTVRGRIKYSKPRDDTRKNGKFSANETSLVEDRRRKEPRYNYIRRRKPKELESSTTLALNSTEKIPESTVADIKSEEKKFEPSSQEKEENQKSQPLINTKNNGRHSSEETENLSKKYPTESSIEKSQEIEETTTKYVIEQLENTTPTPLLSATTEFSKLTTFLKNDPPGYAEAFTEISTKKSPKFEDNSKTSDTSEEKGDDRNTSKSFYRSYFSDEQSSEKIETEADSSPSSESTEMKEPNKSSSKEETFFTYSSRPSSPAENFGDGKYSDLGPRINKPAFFHPPFAISRYKVGDGSIEYLREDDESDSDDKEEERRKKHDFSWFSDKDERNKRDDPDSIDSYEFPWERRERLARERRRRKKDNRRTRGRFDEDDDAVATKNKEVVHPWNNYDSVKNRWNLRNSDSEESSSEHRPTKFSSRYNSKTIKTPLNDKPLINPGKLEEISKSIKKVLEDDSEQPKNNFQGKKYVSFERNRGISRGLIIPEDVTLPPTGRFEKKKNSRISSSDSEVTVKSDEKNESSEDTKKKNNMDNSESETKIVNENSRIESNSTRQSKRRRRPSSNAISAAETALKPVESAVKNRRRQRVSTTTPTIPVATSTTASLRNTRRRNQRVSGDLKRNASGGSETKKNDENYKTETSTPKSRTLEHRSKVTKEKIITRTTYPKEEKEKTVEDVKIPRSKTGRSRGNKKNGKNRKNESMDEISVEKIEKNHDVGVDDFDESEFKGLFPAIKDNVGSIDESPSESFRMDDEELKTLNGFGTTDDISNDDEIDGEIGGILNSEDRVAGNLLQNEPLQIAKTRQIERNENKRNSSKQEINNAKNGVNKFQDIESQDKREAKLKKQLANSKEEEILPELKRKFIKDPQKRLYYYVE